MDARRLAAHHPDVLLTACHELVLVALPAVEELRSTTARVALQLFQVRSVCRWRKQASCAACVGCSSHGIYCRKYPCLAASTHVMPCRKEASTSCLMYAAFQPTPVSQVIQG